MNIIPKQRFSDQPDLQFKREHYDVFSPIEYLDGNSLCDYLIYESTKIEDKIKEQIEENEKEKANENYNNPINIKR